MPLLTRRTLLAAAAALATGARAQTEAYAAAAAYNAARRGVSMVVMVNGRTVFEDYPNGGAPDQPRPLASGTKSFTGVMAAAAVQDRLFELDQPAARFLTE